jgi:hypothetical protein
VPIHCGIICLLALLHLSYIKKRSERSNGEIPKTANNLKSERMHPKSIKIVHMKDGPFQCVSPVRINKVQLPQAEDVKYLGLHLDRRFTWHQHIFTKRKQLGITITKMHWFLGRKSKLSTNNKILVYKTILIDYSNPSGHAAYNSGAPLLRLI